ncbi:DUF2490 domain-containing protein [Flammeovirga sp. SJP92]|uniref:DUF2490 domain-containing protein n=1 Tax=Flammeovirga sp. SJP92 TaxID=1775430 RepID=UPI0007881127|nr:DUF2490 domain-containing protein [Flammeovirga sp. SJP92]KXX70200.1 hypothetical protein AVL50_15155 [Flammeovirga sp. SJP92]
MKQLNKGLLIIVFSILSFTSIKLNAQDVSDNRLWLHYFNSVSLSDNWSIDTDAAYMAMFDKPVDRFQIRSGLKRKVNKNLSIRFGLGYFYVFGEEDSKLHEIRPMQDFIGTHNLTADKKLFIKQRLRFEQQIFSATLNETEENEVDYRMRYSFILRKKLENWIFGFGTEAFINLENKEDNPLFNKNRTIALVNRTISSHVSLEAQYIREDSFRKGQGSHHHADLLRVAVRHKI